MKVCLAHDWLTGMRGGEKVLETLCHLFPDAPIQTLFHFEGSVSPLIENREIRTSPLNKVLQWHPWLAQKYRHFLPLYPWAVGQTQPDACDLILSTSHCVMRGLPKPKGAFHISYIHTPMRYIYDRFDDYFGPGHTNFMTRQFIKMVAVYLRAWEQSTQERADAYLCNSQYVRERIQRIYKRDATVVYPPVALSRFRPRPRTERDGYYLYLGALVPYKKPDIAVKAFTELNLPLVMAGGGPMEASLRAMAGDSITFCGRVDDADIPDLYANAKAFVFPGEEDFGITPLEAQACGTPVIALGRGGALETVRGWSDNDPGTGLFFSEPTVAALKKAILFFEKEKCDDAMVPDALHAWSSAFDVAEFEKNLKDGILGALPQGLENPFL